MTSAFLGTSLAFITLVLTAAPAVAGSEPLMFNDKRLLGFFDKDYARYLPYFETIDAGKVAELTDLVAKLEARLGPISAKGKTNPEVLERVAQLDALKAKLAAAGGAAPAPAAATAAAPAPAAAPPAAAGPSDPDRARAFKKDYDALYSEVRRLPGAKLLDDPTVEGLRARIAALGAHIDGMKDPSQPFVAQMKQNRDSLSTGFEAAVAKAHAQAAPKPEPTTPAAAARPAATPVAAASGPKPLGSLAQRQLTFFDKDMQRYAKDFEAMDPKEYDTLATCIKNLESRFGPIAAEANHPDVIQRKTRLAELQAKFAAAFPDGKPAAAAPTVKPLDPTDARFIAFFDKDWARYATMFANLDPREVGTIRQCLDKLKAHLGRLGYHAQLHPDAVARREKLADVTAKVDAAFGKLRPLTDGETKKIGEFRALFNGRSFTVTENMNPIALQDPEVKKRAEDALADLWKPLSEVGEKNHPDFLVEKARYDDLKTRLDAAIAKSISLAANAGDIDGQLALIQGQFPRDAFDPTPPKGATPDQIEEWARALRNWNDAVAKALDFFKRVEKLSIKARSDEFFQYRYWFENNVRGKISSALAYARRDFEAPIHQGLNPLIGGQNSSDPAKVKLAMDQVTAGIDGASRLLAVQRGYDGAEDPELVKKLATMRGLVEKIQGGAAEALKNERLPEPVSTDPTLLATARRLIAEDTEWGIGSIRGLVINYDKHRRERVTYHDGWFYRYIWDEYQVTFAEQDGTDWWVRTALFKNYVLGADCTIGEWQLVSSQRWSKILPENIRD